MNELVKFNAADARPDPSTIVWPASLPVEIALKTAPLKDIQAAYDYDDESWLALKDNPAFLADLAAAVEMVKREGASFRLKAQLQADDLLNTSYRLINAPFDEVPSSVKADLIKATVRWAGYDNKEAAGVAGGTAFQININLGG